MHTIFMNSENSKTPKSHVLVLKLTNKLDLTIEKKVIPLSNLSIFYTWKNIKSSYSVSDIQDYLEYISKETWESADKPSIRIYVNKIENRVIFKIKNGYSLELLTPEIMKLLGSTRYEVTKDKNGDNVTHLEGINSL